VTQPDFPQNVTSGVPCLPLPSAAIPTLPLPFTIPIPKIPTVKFAANVCCIPITFQLKPLSPPLPPLIVGAEAVVILRQATAAIRTLISQLPLKCPRA
jgi:hypothetical protein